MVKRLLLLIFSIFYIYSTQAQISLTATVGTLSGTYTTLSSTFTAINAGTHQGIITISLTGNTSETAASSLNASGSGSASYTRISIKPSGGGARSVTGSITTSLVQLNGASNISIDGLNTGGNSLTFENTNTGINAMAFEFINGASTDTIKNITIKGSCAGSGLGLVTFSTSTGSTGNINNVISGCTFKPSGSNSPVWDIYGLGTAGKENTGILIDNNNFEDFYGNASNSGGIWISLNNYNLTISNNHFYWTSSKPTAINKIISAITIANSAATGYGFVITNNYIGGSARYCGGTPLTVSISGTTVNCQFYGIQIYTYNGFQSAVVSKNKINNFLWRSSSSNVSVPGVWTGIFSTNTNATIGGVLGNGNIIGCANGADSITVELSTGVAGTLISGIELSAASGPAILASVKNNIIGGITINSINSTGTNVSSNGGVFRGIGLAVSASNNLIDSNIIGNYTANNIKYGFAVNSTTVNDVQYGIYNISGTGTNTISNNIIQNFYNNYVPTSAVSLPQIYGIYCLTGDNIITGNTIRSLTAAANASGTLNNSSITGIGVNTSVISYNSTVSNNRIIGLYNLNASSAATIQGVFFQAHPVSSGNLIERNFIQGLKTTGTGLNIYGLSLASAPVTVINNMIRLGTTESGTSMSSDATICGILCNSAIPSIYHNSICISGTVTSSTLNTYAVNIAFASASNDVRNNIISNQRTNTAGSGLHYLVKTIIGSTLTLNYNVYFKAGATSLFSNGTTDFTTLRLWREALVTAQGMDTNSVIANPKFTSIVADSGSIGLNINGTATAIEGKGASISSVTTDYYGNTRSSLTPNDIGANAGNFTAFTTDIWQPNFTYTVLGNTSSSGSRTISVAITDLGGGVYRDTNTNSPRMRFRRSYPSASSWVSVPGTLTSGTINLGYWNFTINYSLLGITPTVGDTIQYYFIAMDSTANNIWYSPFVSASHTSPGAAVTAPTNPNTYCLVAGLGGVVSVNTANTPNGTTLFTSLTGAAPGGLFASMNASRLKGNLYAIISSDLLEPGTNALNQFNNDSIYANFQIIGDGTLRTIYNSADIATPLIRINGADRVIIDGGSGQNLLFRNTHATPSSCFAALIFDNTSINDTLRNCILESNSSKSPVLSNGGVLSIYTTGSNSVYVKSNKIRSATGGSSGSAAFGAIICGTSIATFINNEFVNDTSYGILNYNTAIGSVISGNSFYFTSATTTVNWTAIYTLTPCTIDGNYIGGTAANCGGTALTFTANTATFAGVYSLSSSTTDYVYIYNNTIQNIAMTGTTNLNFKGIYPLTGLFQIGNTAGNGNLIGHTSNANSINIGSGSAIANVYGIYSTNSPTTSISYSSNTVANLTVSSAYAGNSILCGIYVLLSTGTVNDTIANNLIYNLNSTAGHNYTVGSESVLGIYYVGTTRVGIIQNNTIYGLADNGTAAISSKVSGIYLALSGANSIIKGNKIYDLFNNRSISSITGIITFSSSALIVCNNMISLTNDLVTSNVNVIGIVDYCSSTSAVSYYYNSIYIGGAITASANNWSACFSKSNGSMTDLKNNLFYNERTGGINLGNVTIAGMATTSWASNYNLLISSSSTQAAFFITTTYNFSSFKSNSGGDANSMYETSATIPADSIFTDKANGDLTIPTAIRHAWYVNGTGIPITGFADDYNGTGVRSTTITTGASDIGADEVVLTTVPNLSTMTLVSGTISNGSTQVYNFGSRQFLNITWYGTGLPTSAVVSYLPGSYNLVSCSGKNQSDAYFLIVQSGATGNALTDWFYTLKIFYDEATLRAMNEASANFGLAKRGVGGNCSSWQVFDTTNSGSPTNFFVDYTSNFIGRREAHVLGIFGISDRTAPLPVKLISFDAALQNNQVELKWHTASEINNDHFDIERSDDGIHFRKIGEMKGAYTTYQKQHYRFIDINPIVSTVYYRLKQVDINENFEYSNVEVVQANSRNSVIVTYPNPCTTEFNLPITSVKNQSALVSIYNAQGVLVSSNNIDCIKGANSSKIAVQDLPSGYYIIRIELEESTYTTSVMKQ